MYNNLSIMNKGLKLQHLYLQNGLVNPEIFQKNVVIWGAGKDGKRFWNALSNEQRSHVLCFWDKSSVSDKELDCKIIPPEEKWVYQDTNLVLAFSKWNEVISFINLQDFGTGGVYVDQPYMNYSNSKCIICGGSCCESKAHFAPFIQKREFAGKAPNTKVIKCMDCGFVFSEYRPNDEEMNRLYSGYRNEEYYSLRNAFEPEYTKGKNSITLTSEHIRNRHGKIVSFVSDLIDISEIHSVLDYGGDEGQMIPEVFSHASRAVFEVSGNKTKQGIELINDLEELKKGKYDFIMCCHLLEHVADPKQIFLNMINVLSPNGYLYIEVPYETVYERYSDYAFHEHINFFTVDALKRIGAQHGLRCLRYNLNPSISIIYSRST